MIWPFTAVGGKGEKWDTEHCGQPERSYSEEKTKCINDETEKREGGEARTSLIQIKGQHYAPSAKGSEHLWEPKGVSCNTARQNWRGRRTTPWIPLMPWEEEGKGTKKRTNLLGPV